MTHLVKIGASLSNVTEVQSPQTLGWIFNFMACHTIEVQGLVHTHTQDIIVLLETKTFYIIL